MKLFKGNFFTATLLLGAMTLSSFANAGFMALDWKAETDNRAFLTEENGVEWLKLNETAGMSLNQVQAELGVGGLYEGWRLPTQREVYDMVNQFIPYVVDPNSSYHAYRNPGSWTASMAEYSIISGVLGSNYAGGSIPVRSSVGMYVNDNGTLVLAGVQLNQSTFAAGHRLHYYSNYTSTYTGDSVNPVIGIFLVGDGGLTLTTQNNMSLTANNPNSPYNATTDVPEPASFALFGLGLLGLFCRKSQIKVA